MRGILLFTLFFVVASAKYLEDTHLPAVTEDDDAEILIKKFNKCAEDQYFDLYTASCQTCNKCPKGQFVVSRCGIFDDTDCASCNNKAYSDSRAYRKNCRSLSASGPFKLRDGMRGPIPADMDTPWEVVEEVRGSRSKRIVSIKLQSNDIIDKDFDSNEIPELVGNLNGFNDKEYDSNEEIHDSNEKILPLPPRFQGFSDEDDYEDLLYDDVEEELSAEVKDPKDIKTVDAQVIVKAAKPIVDNTGVLEIMMVKEEDSDSASSSAESDEKDNADADTSDSASSEEDGEILTNDKVKEGKSISDSFKELHSNVLAWNILTKFFVFLGYIFAVLSIFITYRYIQNMRRQRTFNVQPLVLTQDQHYDLIRTVNHLQNKRRGPFKYEPLEEFV